VYVIEQGIIKLVWLDEKGQELIPGLRYPRWLLGAPSVILQQPYPVTAVTLIPCRVRRIRGDEFRRLARTNVEVSWLINQVLSREIWDHLTYACSLGLESARHRLEQFLWHVMASLNSGETDGPVRLELPLKQAELARLIAITESYLSRLLKELEEDGLLRRDRGWVIIPDPEKLWHSADW